MKFYLASSFDFIGRVKETAAFLEKIGHEITQKWWISNLKTIGVPDVEWYMMEDVKEMASKNFNGVRDADIFVLVSSSYYPARFCGANIELGYALALGKKCYSIGKLDRSAMYVPVKRRDNINDVLREVC